MTTAAICAIDHALSGAAAIDSYEYDAFGNEFTVSGTTPNEMMYRGEQYDSDLGLYYLRARYYNPLTGRFMSRDPIDPGPLDADGWPTDPKSLHKYLYVNGDPINGIDPTGRFSALTYAYIGFWAGVTIVLASAIPYAYCAVHAGHSLGQAIENLRSLRDPLGIAKCAWDLLKSVMNAPFLNFPWK